MVNEEILDKFLSFLAWRGMVIPEGYRAVVVPIGSGKYHVELVKDD